MFNSFLANLSRQQPQSTRVERADIVMKSSGLLLNASSLGDNSGVAINYIPRLRLQRAKMKLPTAAETPV